ncbi:hypothetical protein BDV96DRAFT_93809 [Lophiotrema nucula]|uniref:Azaphilone pigments biosynthesis cluster protein L N-terminal domain-containing protein n=1 Tax=Lophiotrema nucula TaxID=690887 RepID=A0A6A5Z750_9PLEO|nr:hypothetical protein BDV96DRAFT_93809 [Lophiotrema nucula]
MDPLSITVSCITLLGAIATTSKTITSFVREVRDARNDLDSISRELLSLETVLSLLADDVKTSSESLPATLGKQILGIISNCNRVVAEIEGSLAKHGKSKLGSGGYWTVGGGKGDMAKLRMTLEAHKSALDIALDMVTISLAKEIKNDTEEIKRDTVAIRDDTAQILEEIARLQARLPVDDTKDYAPNFVLQRYLDDLTSYAESEFEIPIEDRAESLISCSTSRKSPEQNNAAVDKSPIEVIGNPDRSDNVPSNDMSATKRQSNKALPTSPGRQPMTTKQVSHQTNQVPSHPLSEEEAFSDDSESQIESFLDLDPKIEEKVYCGLVGLARYSLEDPAPEYFKEEKIQSFIKFGTGIASNAIKFSSDPKISPGLVTLTTQRVCRALVNSVWKWKERDPVALAGLLQELEEYEEYRVIVKERDPVALAKLIQHLLVEDKEYREWEMGQAASKGTEERTRAQVQANERMSKREEKDDRRVRRTANRKGTEGESRFPFEALEAKEGDNYSSRLKERRKGHGGGRKARRIEFVEADYRGQEGSRRYATQKIPTGYTQFTRREDSPNCTMM